VSKNPNKPHKSWTWSASKEKAAVMLARGDTIAQTAAAVKVNEKTVDDWKHIPEFSARVQQNIAAFRERFLRHGLARRENRIAKLTELFERQESIVKERGVELKKKAVAGGASGLVCETWKQLGSGEDAQLIPEYAADTGLSREMRGTLQQIAQEVGQWTDKHVVDMSATVTTYDAERLKNLSDDELAALTAVARKLAVAREPGSGSDAPGAE
jgi:hypothetical protein